jgi:enoyl-CoA hydratase/carnithine racemase
MSTESLILFDTDDHGVATITLNRPEKYNAFTKDMIDRWGGILEKCETDPKVKVVVLTGAGKAFCTGGDISAQKDRANNDSLERKDFLWRHVHKIAFVMERMDKPTIAAINGAARGAGLDMALMCDLRTMADTATLAESYINVGPYCRRRRDLLLAAPHRHAACARTVLDRPRNRCRRGRANRPRQ